MKATTTIKSATVQFRDTAGRKKSGLYHYLVLPSQQNIVKGGNAVVDSPYGGLVVVDVVAVNEEAKGTAYIVGVVDIAAYTEAKEKEKRLKQIKKELETARKATEEKIVYKMLAKDNPTMAVLLRELEELGG